MANLKRRPGPAIAAVPSPANANGPAVSAVPNAATPPEARLEMVAEPFEFWSLTDLFAGIRRRPAPPPLDDVSTSPA
jgi:hypothetical protein